MRDRNKKSIGMISRKIANQMKRNIDKIGNDSGIEGMTGLHHMFLGYLKDTEGQEIFQKDIEQRFNIRRSTATGILQLMEKNELIVRESVSRDARLKKIVLTDKAKEISKAHYQKILLFEERLKKGLTEEEVDTFFNLAEKILENAKGEKDDKEITKEC